MLEELNSFLNDDSCSHKSSISKISKQSIVNENSKTIKKTPRKSSLYLHDQNTGTKRYPLYLEFTISENEEVQLQLNISHDDELTVDVIQKDTRPNSMKSISDQVLFKGNAHQYLTGISSISSFVEEIMNR